MNRPGVGTLYVVIFIGYCKVGWNWEGDQNHEWHFNEGFLEFEPIVFLLGGELVDLAGEDPELDAKYREEYFVTCVPSLCKHEVSSCLNFYNVREYARADRKCYERPHHQMKGPLLELAYVYDQVGAV